MILDTDEIERHAQRYDKTGWVVDLCRSHEELRERAEIAEERIERIGEILKEYLSNGTNNGRI